MTLKNKTALFASLSFTIVFVISATIIYIIFANFRKNEFENRLRERAHSLIKLLSEVDQVDRQLLEIIDQNNINKLYNKKTMIFDGDYHLIYSSFDGVLIKWTIDDLKELKLRETFYRKENKNEVFGFFYTIKDKDYYALISADDSYGKRNLDYLIYIMISSYLILTAFTWFLSYSTIQKLLSPLYEFLNKTKEVSENNLDYRIKTKKKKDEVDLLAIEFNQMLERINQSYKIQQEFTSNASHELRTPLARLMAQLENKISDEKSKNGNPLFYINILNDVTQLSELTNSLLLLSKLDRNDIKLNETCSLDEVIFDAAEKINKLFPKFKMQLNMTNIETTEIKGNKALLDIAFTNLLKNAFLYSENNIVDIKMNGLQNHIKVLIINDGETMSEEEQKKIFEPFMRGENAKKRSGVGLGLRITKRILSQQNVDIQYIVSKENKNTFMLLFPI